MSDSDSISDVSTDSSDEGEWKSNTVVPVPDITATYTDEREVNSTKLSEVGDWDNVSVLRIDHTKFHRIVSTLYAGTKDICKVEKNIPIDKLTHYPIEVKEWPPKMKRLELVMTAVVEPMPNLPEGCEVVTEDKEE